MAWRRLALVSGCTLASTTMTAAVEPTAGSVRITADSVVVVKSVREMYLFAGSDTLAAYTVALGRHPVGPKTRQGDGKTPEGRYLIDWHNDKSRYHLSLHISYPNAADRARADSLGITELGGDIMIHGLPPAYAWIGAMHVFRDWTNGCIAVTNEEIEEIWNLVPDGTPIILRP